jgi:hypothetical protein
MMKWNKSSKTAILEDPIELMPNDLQLGIEKNEITLIEAWNLLLDAIQMAQDEIDYLAYQVERDDSWLLFASSILRYRKERLERLIEYKDEIQTKLPECDEHQLPETDISSEDQSSPSLSRIVWKGKKSDFARVYSIIGRLMDCSKAEWERHFMDSKGGNMTKATDDHKGGKTNTQEVIALQRACSEMEPIE